VAVGDWGDQFLTSAREAFHNGSYSDALRLANHSAVETPHKAKPHELMSLALFALKDYRGANIEAHTALSLGPPSDWKTLYGYYGDLPTYTKQLDALVDYISKNEKAMDARFVLAYQNMMMGHRDAAKKQIENIIAYIPKDQLAIKLLKDLGGSTMAATEKTESNNTVTEPKTETGL
jgi:tetratricopeptide (TPR) repeat protein